MSGLRGSGAFSSAFGARGSSRFSNWSCMLERSSKSGKQLADERLLQSVEKEIILVPFQFGVQRVKKFLVRRFDRAQALHLLGHGHPARWIAEIHRVLAVHRSCPGRRATGCSRRRTVLIDSISCASGRTIWPRVRVSSLSIGRLLGFGLFWRWPAGRVARMSVPANCCISASKLDGVGSGNRRPTCGFTLLASFEPRHGFYTERGETILRKGSCSRGFEGFARLLGPKTGRV